MTCKVFFPHTSDIQCVRTVESHACPSRVHCTKNNTQVRSIRKERAYTIHMLEMMGYTRRRRSSRMNDSRLGYPYLFFYEDTRVSGSERSGNVTTLRHIGHVGCCSTHGTMQSTWNTCAHGSAVLRESPNAHAHTGHASFTSGCADTSCCLIHSLLLKRVGAGR
jgi:hypothetical protein